MSDDVKLIVGSDVYSGWESVSIRRSLDEAIHSIDLGVVDGWAGAGLPRVRNGAPFQVRLGDALITTGYLDRTRRHYDSEQRSVNVRGRSKAADLIDCSYPMDKLPSTWQNQTVLAICNALAKPFGVTVMDSSGLAEHRVDVARISQGDTSMDIILAYMRVIGARIVSLPDGNLGIVSASTNRLRTALKLGDNILSAEDDNDLRDRFSDYRIVSQRKGTDHAYGLDTASVVGTSHDATMAALRYRPTTVNSETMLSGIDEANKRATVARNVAAGHSHQTTYEVPGWRHADGIWAPNNLVHVIDPECGWDDWLMIGTVELLLDERGKIGRLTVMPATAYDITAVPADQPGLGF